MSKFKGSVAVASKTDPDFDQTDPGEVDVLDDEFDGPSVEDLEAEEQEQVGDVVEAQQDSASRGYGGEATASLPSKETVAKELLGGNGLSQFVLAVAEMVVQVVKEGGTGYQVADIQQGTKPRTKVAVIVTVGQSAEIIDQEVRAKQAEQEAEEKLRRTPAVGGTQ